MLKSSLTSVLKKWNFSYLNLNDFFVDKDRRIPQWWVSYILTVYSHQIFINIIFHCILDLTDGQNSHDKSHMKCFSKCFKRIHLDTKKKSKSMQGFNFKNDSRHWKIDADEGIPFKSVNSCNSIEAAECKL